MLAGIDRLGWLGVASPQAAARRCRAGFALVLSQVCVASGARRGDGPPDALDRLGVPAGTPPRPISEILRLRAPLVDIVRELAEPVRLGDQRLAAGATVLIAPPLIHRCEHREPDRFIADRFLGQRPDPRTWLPFGGGDRRCLGASLALLELREILTHVVRNFTLEPAGGQREDVRLHGTALVPACGARVTLRPR